MKGRNILKNQKGFTLIEIIAVLVILGILAAVAVPKYFAMANEAEAKAVQAVGAEVQARANLYFANQLIVGNGVVAPAGGTTLSANIGAVPVQNEFPNWTIADATGLTANVGEGSPYSKAHTIAVTTGMTATTPAIITTTVIP